jgi:two-component system phosphate regulon response regulator PhoB
MMMTADARGQPRILVVEDDAGVTRMLHISLAAAGFDSTEARNGQEALDVLRQETVDAVILDLVLPDGLGGVVLDWLRRPPPHCAPAWVVISALAPREVAARHGELGENFFPKPFDPWDLIRRLNKLLQTRGPQPKGGEGP